MTDEYEDVGAGDERRKNIFWRVMAIGLVIALKDLALILDWPRS